MPIGRREFLVSAGAFAAMPRPATAGLQPSGATGVFPASVRADFPSGRARPT